MALRQLCRGRNKWDEWSDRYRVMGSAVSMKLTPALFQTPLRAFLLLLGLLACLEPIVRFDAVRAYLPPPSVDSGFHLVDLQIAKMRDFAARHRRIDCVFLGASPVLRGLDPAIFGRALTNLGKVHGVDEPIHCYNAANEALMGDEMGVLARIIAEDYRPALIVFGVSIRDVSKGTQGPGFLRTSWFRYRNGEPSPLGWAIEHLASVRTLFAYLGWIDPFRRQQLVSGKWLRDDGFVEASRSLLPTDAGPRLQAAKTMLMGLLQAGQAPQHLQGLDAIADLVDQTTQLVAVEMPANKEVAAWAEDVPAYLEAREEMRRRLLQSGGLWVGDTLHLDLVNRDDLWFDTWHFNARGAELFSEWLAEQVSDAVADGTLPSPFAAPARP